ncbi:TolC family protein [Variovorax sp. YR752]|uniref:TolC family protein n=1 Tax=Variovorax sp. YR752 TaxID=1884383 RepID=UPI0031383682
MATSIALCLALGTQAALAQSPLSLERAVAEAAGRSQLVTAADAQARAARETASAAGQLPDPVLKLGLNNLPIDGPDRYSVTRDFMTMRSVGVMQELTRADKRNARVRRAEREIELAQVTRQATIADLQRDTALAWLERSYQESLRDLLQSQIAQAELQVQAAETLYRSGKGSQVEVFAARGSAEQLRDGLAQAERQVAVAITQLGRWVGESATQPLAPRAALTLPAWTEGALPQHLSQHPQIAAAAQQAAIADSEAAVARAAKSSDWSVELQYSQRGPAYSNMVSINLSVPLQWDQKNRQDRELAARLAGVDEARARREELQRAHEAEVRSMLQEWRSHEERLGRYDASLLPLATQRSEAALASYRAGSGPLTAVLDARRSEIDVRTERLRIELDRARIWAQLYYLLPSHDGAQGKPEAAQ